MLLFFPSKGSMQRFLTAQWLVLPSSWSLLSGTGLGWLTWCRFFWSLKKRFELVLSVIFFYQDFSSRTLTTHKTVAERRISSFIPLYHLHSLTSIQTFIFNFTCDITIKYFSLDRLCLPDCYSIKFTTSSNYHLIDWIAN